MTDHAVNVWGTYVLKSGFEKVYIVAHSAGVVSCQHAANPACLVPKSLRDVVLHTGGICLPSFCQASVCKGPLEVLIEWKETLLARHATQARGLFRV